MNRKLISLLLLIVLVLAGCAKPTAEPPAISNEPRYLTRVNFYSENGKLLDQYQLEYDPTGMPVKITTGIMADEKVDWPLGGAPMLPEGVDLSKAEETYNSILIAPCEGGRALLIKGSAEDPLWGMVLYGDAENDESRNGYLSRVTANDGSYVALFYSTLLEASSNGNNGPDSSFAVTENSDYFGYDEVLNTLGTAMVSMDQDAPVTLNDMLFSPLYGTEPSRSNIGYTFIDLDQNGTMELIVGSNGQYGRSVIYDLYAIYNGRIVNVLSSTESVRHTLSARNEILVDTQNSDGQTVFAIYSYFNSSVRMVEAVIQGNGERFHTTSNFNDSTTFESISYGDASAIQEEHAAIEIEFTSIYAYLDATGITNTEE